MDNMTILIIEDEPTINRIISSYFLKENYNVLSALDGSKGLELFNENKVDLICLDIMMPKVNGWDVAKEIRKTSHVPIIMMTALAEEEDILKGYSLKVDDYITKPFAPKVLVAKIKNLLDRLNHPEYTNKFSGTFEVGGITMEFDSYGENRKLKELLTNDDLTGISNRRYLDFFLNNMKSKAEEFDTEFGVLFFDIDDFKKVNDIYGHNVGDEVLKLISFTLKNNIRTEDLVGRWGGEEFIAVIQADNSTDLFIIAEKLRNLISNAQYKLNDSKTINVTVSVGGSMFKNNEAIASLISRADKNMYNSKENGKNKVTVN